MSCAGRQRLMRGRLRNDLPGRVTHHCDKACVEDRECAYHCLCRIGDYAMAADATEQTTAAKTESASQTMYRGAGKVAGTVVAGTVVAGTVYAGTIVEIGRKSDGSRSVVFRSSSSTFDTQWPKWAYQIAMAAFLYDKQIQVIADGQPDGDKLLSVKLFLPLHPPHQGPQPAPRAPRSFQRKSTISQTPGFFRSK
jgi:hypothetical protein